MNVVIQGPRRADRSGGDFLATPRRRRRPPSFISARRSTCARSRTSRSRGPKGEPLYLGHKYSFHSFLLPYRLTDDGYIFGVQGRAILFPVGRRQYQIDAGARPATDAVAALPIVRAGLRHGSWRLDRAGRHHRPDPAVDDLKEASQARQPHLAKTASPAINPATCKEHRQLQQGRGDRSEVCRSAATFAARPMLASVIFKAGISDHTKAIRIEPKFADALMDRGILMHQSGNFDGAISDFSRVIKLNRKMQMRTSSAV